MNRSVLRERFTTTGIAPGEAVIATTFRHPDRGTVSCPAAPALKRMLHQQQIMVRSGRAPVTERGDGVLLACSYLDRTGRPVGFAIAAHRADAAALTAADRTVEAWSRTLRTRRLLLAATQPRCHGVVRAAATTQHVLAAATGPVYCLGRPGDDMTEKGAVVVDDLEQVPDDATLLIPAHGAPLEVRLEAAARGLTVIDLTCPLVTAAQDDVRRFADRGDTPVVIGHPGHGAAPALLSQTSGTKALIESVTDAQTLDVPDPMTVSYVPQPGLPLDEVLPIAAALRARFPTIRAAHPATFCHAATDRQAALRTAMTLSDLVLIAGDAGCPDARRLLAFAGRHGATAEVITHPADLNPRHLTSTATLTLTAALSAAPALVEEIIAVLSGLGPLAVSDHQVTTTVVPAAAPLGQMP